MSVIAVVIAVLVVLAVGLVYMATRGRRGTQRLEALPEESRRGYAEEWRVIETRFIDQPAEAVSQADHLAVRILQERGADLQDRRRLPRSLANARRRSQNRGGESLRRAMQHYQEIVDEGCGRDVREAAERGRFELA